MDDRAGIVKLRSIAGCGWGVVMNAHILEIKTKAFSRFVSFSYNLDHIRILCCQDTNLGFPEYVMHSGARVRICVIDSISSYEDPSAQH